MSYASRYFAPRYFGGIWRSLPPSGVYGILDAAETRDQALFAGLAGRVGYLDSSENPDTAFFYGQVLAPEFILGILDARERGDVAAFIGSVINSGVLDAVEQPDRARFLSGIDGVLYAIEQRDTAVFLQKLHAAEVVSLYGKADSKQSIVGRGERYVLTQ